MFPTLISLVNRNYQQGILKYNYELNISLINWKCTIKKTDT